MTIHEIFRDLCWNYGTDEGGAFAISRKIGTLIVKFDDRTEIVLKNRKIYARATTARKLRILKEMLNSITK